MQWLNKVDEALDWVLGPIEPAEEGAGAASLRAAGSARRGLRPRALCAVPQLCVLMLAVAAGARSGGKLAVLER